MNITTIMTIDIVDFLLDVTVYHANIVIFLFNFNFIVNVKWISWFELDFVGNRQYSNTNSLHWVELFVMSILNDTVNKHKYYATCVVYQMTNKWETFMHLVNEEWRIGQVRIKLASTLRQLASSLVQYVCIYLYVYIYIIIQNYLVLILKLLKWYLVSIQNDPRACFKKINVYCWYFYFTWLI